MHRRGRGGSNWNNGRERVPRPAHLRGKEIGLYYRDLNKKKGPKSVKDKNNKWIILRIPKSVTNKIDNKLRTISLIAKRLNITIPHSKVLEYVKVNDGDVWGGTIIVKSEPIEQNDDSSCPTQGPSKSNSTSNICWSPNDDNKVDLKAIKVESKSSFEEPEAPLDSCLDSSLADLDSKPIKIESNSPFKKPEVPVSPLGTYSDSPLPDFIPISKYKPKDEPRISIENPLTLQAVPTNDYKYGYQDIITGTFDEKLEVCLAKGISINMVTDDIIQINKVLQEEYKEMEQRNDYKKLMKFREILPAYRDRQKLLNVINNNQVVVISGETGCGKSTQVPQIILDDAILNNRGANVKIVVTQPRRIAASSLAARVAEERSEKMGNSVGYSVRLERIDPRPRGSILYCTTGILLADLEVNQGLTNYTHVILDEVHERDVQIDVSMCMLKKVLIARKDLKLILMSATIDAETLSSYFDNCPVMHIEGLAYPVKDIYLEEILQMTNYKLPEQKPAHNNFRMWRKYSKKFKYGKNVVDQETIQYRAEVGPWLQTIKSKIGHDVYQTLSDPRIESLNIDLINTLLVHICKNNPPGAILVFLPGIGEISKLMRIMEQSNMFPSSHYEIFPLHSKLPSLDQRRIFERPPKHIRKIIIATNIAETSITIDDIVYVVDCGKLKLSGLSVDENISTLKIEWVSQANLRQRRGRAGRCQPGVCFHLVTSWRAGKLDERLLPELQRSNLLEPVLTIKRLRLGKAVDAMKLVPSPPAQTTVEWAVKHLQQCGALDDQEILTPLGWHLARLPVHPSAGKLLLLGSLFGCLDRAASVAAVWGFKDPFQLVIGREEEVDNAKRSLALGEPSDHVAISEAIIQWENSDGRGRRAEFAYKHYLSNHTLQLLSEMKQHFGDSMRQMGFLPSGDVKAPWENRNSNNLSLFKAVVAASLYPNIASVKWRYGRITSPRFSARTPEEDRPILVHPSSVMVANSRPGKSNPVRLCISPGANWLVYWLKQRSSDLFLIEVTFVYTLPLLFFGELKNSVEYNVTRDECAMNISKYQVICKKETTELLYRLRFLLDQVLASKVMASNDRSTNHSDFEECVLNAVIELITAEDEGVEYIEDDDDTNSESEHSEAESSLKIYN